MSKLKYEPKEETRKLLLRLIGAVQGNRIDEASMDGTLDSCVQDLELIWSGKDNGSRWTIGFAELREGFKNDPDMGLDDEGNVVLKKKS